MKSLLATLLLVAASCSDFKFSQAGLCEVFQARASVSV